MNSAQDRRLASPVVVQMVSVFSSNQSVLQKLEALFSGRNPAMIRCFSYACDLGSTAYVEETIAHEGMIEEENENLDRSGFWYDDNCGSGFMISRHYLHSGKLAWGRHCVILMQISLRHQSRKDHG